MWYVFMMVGCMGMIYEGCRVAKVGCLILMELQMNYSDQGDGTSSRVPEVKALMVGASWFCKCSIFSLLIVHHVHSQSARREPLEKIDRPSDA
jgi:hypothetical protein